MSMSTFYINTRYCPFLINKMRPYKMLMLDMLRKYQLVGGCYVITNAYINVFHPLNYTWFRVQNIWISTWPNGCIQLKQNLSDKYITNFWQQFSMKCYLNGKTKVLLFNGHLIPHDCRAGHAVTPRLAPSDQPEASPSWFCVQQPGVACVVSMPRSTCSTYPLSDTRQLERCAGCSW